MSLLFEIAPDEPEKARKSRPAKKPESDEPDEAGFEPSFKACYGPCEFLGKADQYGIECIYENCRGTAHDIAYDDGKVWLIQCAFCGTGQYVKARKAQSAPSAGAVFRFADGRFSGLSLDEAAGKPFGLEYIEWATTEHKRPAVREACKTWLATRGQTC